MREARIHQLQIKSMDAAYSSSPRQRAHPGERDRSTSHVADLFALGQLAAEPLCQRLRSSPAGLTYEEAARRLQDFGLNLVARERKPTILQEIWGRARNPLNALLLTLAAVSYFIGDMRAAIVIVLMVLLAVGTAFIQEHRSNEAAARLRAMVKTTDERETAAGRRRRRFRRGPDRIASSRRHRETVGRRHDPGRSALA